MDTFGSYGNNRDNFVLVSDGREDSCSLCAAGELLYLG